MLPSIPLADIGSFNFRYLTSHKCRFALTSKSAGQGNRRLLCCIAKCRVVLNSTEGLLAKLSAVHWGMQKLKGSRCCWNFRYHSSSLISTISGL